MRVGLRYLLLALLGSMACSEFVAIGQGNLTLGELFINAGSYTLNAGGSPVTGTCVQGTGECFRQASSATAGVSFLLAKQAGGSNASLLISLSRSGSHATLQAEADATVDTTFFGQAGQKIFARVRRTQVGEWNDAVFSGPETASIRIGLNGVLTAVTVGEEEYTELTLGATDTLTLFFNLSADLSETSSIPFYNTVFVYDIEIKGARPCKKDGECPTESPQCVTPEGICTTGEVGEECTDGGDCVNEICRGTCSDGGTGSSCDRDGDCADPGYCTNSTCFTGLENEYCNEASDCQPGAPFCPQVFAGYGVCSTGRQFSYCVDGQDCATGFACNGGICQPE